MNDHLVSTCLVLAHSTLLCISLTNYLRPSAGNYTQLVISFSFKRRIGYYIIQVYLPDSLVVAISWIVFWLDQDDMGGRVGLGITTILTIMFLLGSVNMSLPRVSYPKAIDWFLIASFLFVFLVLLECIVVYILRPRKRDSKRGADGKILELETGTNDDLEVGIASEVKRRIVNYSRHFDAGNVCYLCWRY